MIVLEFPSSADIRRIYDTTPFDAMDRQIGNLQDRNTSKTGLSKFKRALDIKELIWQLHYRLMDVAKSYALSNYFFEKGIPDDEWHISPGRDGSSIEYFPHFETVHFSIKDWFDYYSDTFYFKFFSALDMIGHLLNVRHELGINQQDVSFRRAVDKLRGRDKSLYDSLDEIRGNAAFREAKRLRDDITHNYLPSSTGMSITLSSKGGGIGIRDYTPSTAVMTNMRDTTNLLERIIACVTV